MKNERAAWPRPTPGIAKRSAAVWPQPPNAKGARAVLGKIAARAASSNERGICTSIDWSMAAKSGRPKAAYRCLLRRRLMLEDEPSSARAGAFEDAPAEQQSDSESNGHPKVHGAIGFIGLGHMGKAMAANLAAAGHRVTAYVRRPDRMSELALLGLEPTTDIAALLDCTVVISMLPDDDAVRDVVLGRLDLGVDGLAARMSPGAIHLSMSTISTAAASDLAREHVRHGQG